MNDFDNTSALLLEELRGRETELHEDRTRRNRERMEMLLHPEFVEFGRSGRRYGRADTFKDFGPEPVVPVIQSAHFELIVLAEGSALLTYVSAHLGADGNRHRHTLRSSLWVRTEVGWQLRFHQGTPTAEVILD